MQGSRAPCRGRGGLSKTVELDQNLHVGDVFETPKGRVVVPEPDQQ